MMAGLRVAYWHHYRRRYEKEKKRKKGDIARILLLEGPLPFREKRDRNFFFTFLILGMTRPTSGRAVDAEVLAGQRAMPSHGHVDPRGQGV